MAPRGQRPARDPARRHGLAIGPTYTEPDRPDRIPHDPRPNPAFPLQLLDVERQEIIRTFPTRSRGGSRLLAWTLAPKGSHAAASVLDSTGQAAPPRLGRGHRASCSSASPCGTHRNPPPYPAPGLAFAPDASLLATWDGSGRVDLWSVADGQAVANFRRRTPCIASRSARITGTRRPHASRPSRWMIAAGGTDGLITLWNPATRGNLATAPRPGRRDSGLAFSPDGTFWPRQDEPRTMLCLGRRHGATSGRVRHVRLHDGPGFQSRRHAPREQSLVSLQRRRRACERHAIFALDPSRGIRHLRGLPGSVMKVVFSRDGKRVAALSWDWWAGVWDRDTGRLIRLFAVPRGQFYGNADLGFSPDARSLAVSAGNTATLWNVESGEFRRWTLPWGLADAIAFPDAEHLMLMLPRLATVRVRRILRHSSDLSSRLRPPQPSGPRPTECLKTITDLNWGRSNHHGVTRWTHFLVRIGWDGANEPPATNAGLSSRRDVCGQAPDQRPVG